MATFLLLETGITLNQETGTGVLELETGSSDVVFQFTDNSDFDFTDNSTFDFSEA